MGDSTEVERDLCLCPDCRAEVSEEATHCPRCGSYFPSLPDRQSLNTPPAFNLLRWTVFAVAVAIGIWALLLGFLALLNRL